MLTSPKLLLYAFCLSAIAPFFSTIISAQTAPPARSALELQQESVRRMERSIARQKAAIDKRQSAPVSCEALDGASVDGVVADAAARQQLDPAVLRAVIRQESAFQPCAVSPKGAMGLMQLMPATAEQFHVTDPFNTEQNVAAGAEYLKQLLERFHGDLKLTLAAYNAGPERVAGDPPTTPDIPETMNYVAQIMKALEKESLERVK